MTPERLTDGVTLIEGDCLEALAAGLIPADASIVSDPPYGMAWNSNSKRFTGGKRALRRGEGRDDWPEIHGDNRPFDPRPWLAFPRVVLWGYTHFAAALPVGTVLVWLKKADHLFGTFLSDCELAWVKGGHGVYAFRKQFPPPSRAHEAGGRPSHPNQKPIALMSWCMVRAKVPDGGLVVDPYAGSGSTAIACVKTRRPCLVIEKDPAYCDVIRRRLAPDSANLFAACGGP